MAVHAAVVVVVIAAVAAVHAHDDDMQKIRLDAVGFNSGFKLSSTLKTNNKEFNSFYAMLFN